jgi:outer membrane protein assembly factor BamB
MSNLQSSTFKLLLSVVGFSGKSIAYELCLALFLPLILPGTAVAQQRAWSGWRGDNRDAMVDKLPESLPGKPSYRWSFDTSADSLSGIAATKQFVLVFGRDELDAKDVLSCLNAEDGSVAWKYDYVALPPKGAEVRDGRLDYGNSPRATPLIVGDQVIIQGAFGDLNCLKLQTGELLWSLNFVLDFDATIPTWGWSSSPLHHDGLIYVQPGAEASSLVAIRLKDGEVEWEAEGSQGTYTSPIFATLGGKQQIVTTDINFWSGFDAKTGTRLWRLKPKIAGEFHVPTALVIGKRLAIIGEANGIRLHNFDSSGKIIAKPTSALRDFNPDTHTPVLVGSNIVGAHHGLWLMSADDVTKHQEVALDELNAYCSILTDGKKFLVLTDSGMLLLYSLSNDKPQELGRLQLIVKNSKIYSHPAWIDSGFIYREGNRVHFVELK